MGGHRSLLMGVVWVWVQSRRKCWALAHQAFMRIKYTANSGLLYTMTKGCEKMYFRINRDHGQRSKDHDEERSHCILKVCDHMT